MKRVYKPWPMSLFDAVKDIFANLFRRNKRDAEWAARFDNQPASRDGKLPLDPGKSQLS